MIVLIGIKQVLSNKKYAMTLVVLIAILFAVFVILPGAITSFKNPNARAGLSSVNLLSMFFLAVLSSLFMTMQIYNLRFSKKAIGGAGKIGLGGIFATFASLLGSGTATCASCLATLLGFLGIGASGALFLFDYRFYFVAAIATLLIFSIYFTSKKIAGVCLNCK